MNIPRRKIDVAFRLGEGAFGASGADTVTVSGLRISSSIIKAGVPSMGTAQLQIFGLTLSLMNKLSTLGPAPTLYRRNTVTVTAGDDQNGMGTVFIGTIVNAYPEFSAMPDVAFVVEAHAGMIESLAPVPVTSVQGTADVATIMSGLATQMGLTFENNGVSVKIANPYLSGSGRNQVQAIAAAAGIEWVIDNGKLAIWKPGESRGGTIPLISPSTGLKGYPGYTSKGVMFSCLFQPSINFGSKIRLESDLTPARGEWVVFSLKHDLDAQMPGGRWFSTIEAARPGFVVVA